MKKFCTFFCGILLIGTVQAQIIHVPADYPTIQLGIIAASPGDTVLVDNGTYYEQINFLGKKSLIVASQFLMDGDTSHITNTIIDGSNITGQYNGSIVCFRSGEDTTSVLCGFTIQNGSMGTYYSNEGVRSGGGVYIRNSGAKLIYNHITENHITDSNLPGSPCYVAGAGISTTFEMSEDWVILDHNIVDNNSVTAHSQQSFGGGIMVTYNAIMTNNVITNNLSTTSGAYANGGGITYGPVYIGQYGTTGIIKNNIISNNQVVSGSSTAYDGGIGMIRCKVVFSGNIVENNSNSGLSSQAGGLHIWGPMTGSFISGNQFRGNITGGTAGGLYIGFEDHSQDPLTVMVENNYFADNEAMVGGAIYASNPVILQNNVFRGNHATTKGGGIYIQRQVYPQGIPHVAVLMNNSFSGNKADQGGGAMVSYGNSKPLVFNSVFWNDSSSVGQEIYLTSDLDTLEIAYSDLDLSLVSGNINNGGNNFAGDPLFQDTVALTISDNSPCYNTGINEYTCGCGQSNASPVYDIDGIHRPMWGYWDIGAHEYQFPVIIENHKSQGDNLGCRIIPNPVINFADISYYLPKSSPVTITVYDSYGQMVAIPLNAIQKKGDQKVHWDSGILQSGVYFIRIEAAGKIGTGSLVKL